MKRDHPFLYIVALAQAAFAELKVEGQPPRPMEPIDAQNSAIGLLILSLLMVIGISAMVLIVRSKQRKAGTE